MIGTRWFNLAIRFVYGFVLPLFLLYLALSSHFTLMRERQILGWQAKMQDSLDNIARFHADEKFFHGLLQASFRRAASASEPMAAVKKLIDELKQRFANKMQFIVWNKDGRIIPELSDERRFQYVIRTLHNLLDSLQNHIETVFPPVPESIAELADRIVMLRSFLGQFLMEKHMINPLLDGYLGSCIRASEEDSRRLLWYQRFEEFGLVCFIDKDLTGKETGARSMVNRFNSSGQPLKLALFFPADRSLHGLGGDEQFRVHMLMQANSFFDSAVNMKRTDRFLFLFRQLSPRLIVFSRLDMKKNLLHVEHETRTVLFGVVKFLFLLIFFVYCASLRCDMIYLSVRQKLMLLFLFANGLPLLILVATGYEFFEQKKNTLVNEAHDQSARIIKEFDNLYPAGRDVAAEKLRNFIAEKNGIFVSKIWPDEEIEELKNIIASLNPSESYLFSYGGEQLFYVGTDAISSSVRFVRDFFGGALDFFNNPSEKFVPKSRTMIEEVTDEGDLYNGVIRLFGRIGQQNYGSGMRWTFMDLLGNRRNYDSWGLLLVAWRSEKLQRAFLKIHLDDINARIAPRKIIVMEKGNETIFPEELNRVESIRTIMHRTLSRKLVKEDKLIIDGRAYVATAMTGNELADAVIMAVHPLDITLGEIDQLFFQVIMAVMASFLVVIAIVKFFSQRLIVPIKSISNGLVAIGSRDFSFRSDYESDDEFGELTRTFNATIEGMQELAVGTAVQVSLLPDSHAVFSRFTLYANSVFMSKMGGDYFDYFPIDDRRFGVYFGDVAGHGIPAALIMAMAKAAIACSRIGFEGPAELLCKMNAIFLSLKSKGLRRMMTALSLEFNSDTGEFRLANAGQCYPVVLKEGGRQIDYVKALGMPLGSASRRPYKEFVGRLEPGDIMVLYSDGIIEATNSAGEVFDFSRFEQLLQDGFSRDLEKFWENIFKGYSGWVAQQDDDITLLMLKYE